MSKSISRAISKGQRDIELLGVLTSNDSSRFNRVIARLQSEARQIASELLGRENIEEAVSKARDKVIDWMRSDAPFKVSHPMAYATILVRNAVIDYSRTTKERAIPEDQIKEDLAWIDGGMGYFGEDEESNGQAGTGGWHGVKVSPGVLGQDMLKLPAIHYPEHGWLRALRPENLGRCGDWFLAGNSFSDVDKRWSQYKLIMALIENIPSLREQQIMKHFLWGYRTTDIAKELDISKAYISKVVTNWLKSWGWDKLQVARYRIILLTHCLAITYSKVAAMIDQKKQQLEKRKVYEDKRAEKVAALEYMLFRNIIKATETKAYFSDLEESDKLGLLWACETCNHLWYAPENLWYAPRQTRRELEEWEWDEYDEKESRRERTQLIAKLPIDKRQLYISSWRAQAEKWDEEESKFLAELERKYCQKLVNF